MKDRFAERVPDLVLVLGVAAGLYALAGLVLLVAAQRAGIRRSAPWVTYFWVSTALIVAWVLLR
jgi:hypothetical protein